MCACVCWIRIGILKWSVWHKITTSSNGWAAHHYWRLHRCITNREKKQTEIIIIMLTTFATKRKQPVKIIVFVWIANQKQTYTKNRNEWEREGDRLIGWSKNSTILMNGKHQIWNRLEENFQCIFICFAFVISKYFPMSFQVRKELSIWCVAEFESEKKNFKSKWTTHKSNASVNKEFYDFSPLIFSLINKIFIIFNGESYIFTHAQRILT